jgi:hypothetical protein
VLWVSNPGLFVQSRRAVATASVYNKYEIRRTEETHLALARDLNVLRLKRRVGLFFSAYVIVLVASRLASGDEVPAELQRWFGQQDWQRDKDGPVLSLGKPGDFDDTHLFAPTVAFKDGKYWMWYCGSRGNAHDLAPQRVPDERVFKLGLATSIDGKTFFKHASNPVFSLPEEKLSLTTPTILRNADGTLVLDEGKLRLWFSSTRHSGGRVQSIQDIRSTDGLKWSDPSPVLLEKAYAPSVLKTESGYAMWYTEPGRYPWLMRHAVSSDGSQWKVTHEPVLRMTQPWEHYVLIYPCVLEVDGAYLMWYASYLGQDRQTTGIGFAASLDGVHWFKHPQNPVLRPDRSRSWESHYVSSHSVIRLADGSFRIWYASRKQPPFTNLYFAINTAHWKN